ncbi:alpha-amylase family glycosyl hydrolase [Robiginitalea aurantiaca]|uniref:Alpha-amylase family glycosyl hydrolase n=1 Tax=Robiginitalea aurantiaca TaxID=3056915 RepID=A0ABT7WE99_9FLAO|nr:alpha-amylase family glycosyl hydrolase [Robiginitalea aurantiaca]MDM9631249.1 alpha-amylase family glycosyl hydrolase [Robiginitalea aurantiaca]
MNQAAIHKTLTGHIGKAPTNAKLKGLFETRLAANYTLIQDLFFSLYPDSAHKQHFTKLQDLLPELFSRRSRELKIQDLTRQMEGNWYQSGDWVGMQLYVDRFCGNLKALEEKIPYFESLGINFLHLMPITKRPSGPNDGGYSVNSYTEIDPVFGTARDFDRLTAAFRDKGICLMLDFVVNHTSDEFPWALKAKRGNPEFQEFYYTFPDRNLPDLYELSLPEVFPETSPGNFTYSPEMRRWVMTVFNSYQWDLNYTNPEVFLAMLTNLVDLSNKGVDVIRFDALAFLWKKIGTTSQNLPEAHQLIALFRLCLQVVAPGVIILAEAIVAPHEIIKYFGKGILKGNECEIAYNATFMACLWNSVATKKTGLLRHSIKNIPTIPDSCTWINYIRCHDDIGLGFDDSHIAAMGWDPQAHRRFLLDYFCQRMEWSPAKGAVFMYNPLTGDGRITGSTASLLGLEKALEEGDDSKIDLAVGRILMLYGIILATPGIPLIYAGDEIAMLNDYSYMAEPDKVMDSRWINRPIHDWETVSGLPSKKSHSSKVFYGLQHLIALRKQKGCFADHYNIQFHDAGNEHLLVFERGAGSSKGILVLANFDDSPQVVNTSLLSALGFIKNGKYHNLIDGTTRQVQSGLLELPPADLLWLTKY